MPRDLHNCKELTIKYYEDNEVFEICWVDRGLIMMLDHDQTLHMLAAVFGAEEQFKAILKPEVPQIVN